MRNQHRVPQLVTSTHRGVDDHVALVNDVWATPDLYPHLPGASPAEAVAFDRAVVAAGTVNLRVFDTSSFAEAHLPHWDSARMVAVLIELTRRYPDAATSPGHLLETAWPVLIEVHRQGLLVSTCSEQQFRHVVEAATGAVVDALTARSGPA